MKKVIIFIIALLLVIACKKTITVEDGGMIKDIEVEELRQLPTEIISVKEGSEQAEIRHCETSGYCYGYGYDYNYTYRERDSDGKYRTKTGKYRHYYGYHSDCDGERRVRFIPVVTTYRNKYQTERGNFISPIKESYEKKTTWTEGCER